ncbi:MAG: FAD-dependent oxidoreductase [Deltaproteobacteria bacterium]|nr:FAD-dependent oxidoreductase [Deltaproteobacteria bacterium]
MSATGVHPLLVDVEGHTELLLGNEAIVRGALEAGVALAAGYPGTPSSEVTDSFARVAAARGVQFEYAVNEKIALELCFAASLAGARSLCAMKHAGLMVAADPLATIPYLGVRAGMVIVSAGDPSCHTSSNEQDQRHLARMLHVPVLDPATPAEAHRMARLAFALSEQAELPVLLRITTRVSHSRAPVRYGPLAPPRVGDFERHSWRWVPLPATARKLRAEIEGRLDRARAFAREAGLFARSGQGRDGILAAGAPAATCRDVLAEQGMRERVVLATLGAVYPIDEAPLVELLRGLDRLLVVEELSTFLEDEVAALCGRHGLRAQILGKRSGHLPVAGEYEPETIARGLWRALGLGAEPAPAPEPELLPPRPPVICPGCPHRATYFAARAAFAEDQLYFNDIGCYTLGYGPPLHAADALLCMGAAFTLAAGVSRMTGRRTVGFMGDSTFFHAGMPPLLDAIKERANMVAVILDNHVTAMTGFQPSPGVALSAGESVRSARLEELVRALGAAHVERFDPADLAAAIAAFARAREASGVAVLIAERPCPVFLARETGRPFSLGAYEVDHDRCRRCGREGCAERCGLGPSQPYARHMAAARARLAALRVDAAETRPDAVAPCAACCPVGLCIQGYAGRIAAGEYGEALELIASKLPLCESVCRVCHHPCEAACVRAAPGEPVAINDLKRFVLDWAARRPQFPYEPEREPDNGMAVAIVGAGPCGLAAAHDLRKRGYDVTVYDAGEKPGGLLRTGIPRFRLPEEALDRDVARILALGIRFEPGRRLGGNLSLDELLAGPSKALLLALGASRAVALEVPGATGTGAPDVVDALAYLAAQRAARPLGTGRSVVVIGGGNAAIDAARTALRAGAAEVTIAYRRTRAEMPALPGEIAAAELEGVTLSLQVLPLAVERGPQGGLRCLRTCPGEPGPDGRRRPMPVPGSGTLLPADQIIVAVGQAADLDALPAELGLRRAPGGSLWVDPQTMRTSHPRIYAGGDLASGSRTVTGAIADGQRAAWAIDRELRGPAAADRRPPPPRPEQWPKAGPHADVRPAARLAVPARQRPAELGPAERRAGFGEVAGTLSEAQARAEASRCQACGQCATCNACLELFGCPAFYVANELVHIDPDVCRGCGVCALFCPGGAIRRVPEATP